MRALIINNHSLHIDHNGEMQQLLNSLGYAVCEQVAREELANYATDEFDLILLSGTSGPNAFPVMRHEEELEPEISLVYAWNKPLIGVCYGCQIMARAHGALLEPLDSPVERQLITVQLTGTGAQLLSLVEGAEFTVYASHKNYISVVPDGWIVVAQSVYGSEIVIHDSKPFVGVMFHPEHILQGNCGAELLRTTLDAIKSR